MRGRKEEAKTEQVKLLGKQKDQGTKKEKKRYQGRKDQLLKDFTLLFPNSKWYEIYYI